MKNFSFLLDVKRFMLEDIALVCWYLDHFLSRWVKKCKSAKNRKIHVFVDVGCYHLLTGETFWEDKFRMEIDVVRFSFIFDFILWKIFPKDNLSNAFLKLLMSFISPFFTFFPLEKLHHLSQIYTSHISWVITI